MTLPIKQLPEAARPRERLARVGPVALSDPEVLALLFGGDRRTADEVVARLGPAPALGGATLAMLREVPGVGPARAAQIVAAVELGRRAAGPVEREVVVRRPDDARGLFAPLAALDQEEMHVVALDGRLRVMARTMLARGTHNVVHVSPRELWRWALREGASSVIAAHNHPSGDPSPSPEDAELTARLRAAGGLVGVPLVDHLVIGSEGWYSFERGEASRW